MNRPLPLVLSDYALAPRLTVSSGVALGIALLSAMPKPAPSPVRFAASRLRGAVIDLQRAWGQQLSEAEASAVALPRDADTRSDRSFRATVMRIEAFTLLGPKATPEYESAAMVRQRLFPEGLRFLTLPFDQQWAHAQRLLDAVDEDEALAETLQALVGESILAELRAAHEAYGDALGITSPRSAPEVVSLAEPLAAVRAAIVGYALQIIAMQDVDPERIAVARKALAPIDDLRARQARRGTAASGQPGEPTSTEAGLDEGDAVSPGTPVPVVEEEAVA